MKKFWMILIYLLVIASACFAAARLASVGDVSLRHIEQKEFEGSGLRIVKLLEENKAYTRYQIAYLSDGLRISGIMNVSKGKGPFPLIILNHGYINPRYYTVGRGLKREQDYLARAGYVVIHPDFRNHGDSDTDPDNSLKMYIGYTEDVLNLISAVKKSDFKFINKEKIGMLGHSMGGGIALNIISTKPGLVKAYVLLAPTSIDYKDNYERWIKKRHPEEEERVAAKYGPPESREKIRKLYGTPFTNPRFWNGLSVRYLLDNISDPVMVHHGTADESVPIAWSEKLVKELKKRNKVIEFYTYKGEKHEFIGQWGIAMKRTVEFFDSYLK